MKKMEQDRQYARRHGYMLIIFNPLNAVIVPRSHLQLVPNRNKGTFSPIEKKVTKQKSPSHLTTVNKPRAASNKERTLTRRINTISDPE